MLDVGKYETLESIEWSYRSYAFDMTEIYSRRSDGALFYASDSGCSCPYPFDNTTEADLTPIRTMSGFNSIVPSGLCEPSREDVNRARETVKQALQKWNS